jgi:hypothetical protein
LPIRARRVRRLCGPHPFRLPAALENDKPA